MNATLINLRIITVSCSKRAFQTQFKRWDFPSKQNPAYKNAPLVARIKELWEHNVNQREMLRILHEEGFDIKERELMRVRAKNRWLLRVPNGTRSKEHPQIGLDADPVSMTPSSEIGHGQEHEALLALQNETMTLRQSQQPLFSSPESGMARNTSSPDPRAVSMEMQHHFQMSNDSQQAAVRRQERLERLRLESTERWAARKRRRRTKGWAGLPADPPGPPRFPSETTIDESKKYLGLSNDMYREARDKFQAICEEFGFLKKTEAGPEKWQAAKTKLVSQIPHLQSILWDSQSPSKMDVKSLALDVLCTDVTKRMRTIQRRMTIADAKNTLGINPEESRTIRDAFYDILKADHFTNKLEAGDIHWNELKSRWIQNSPILQNILVLGPTDPSHTTKLRAIDVLCRDVMKRFRDDQTRRSSSRKKLTSTSDVDKHPGPNAVSKHNDTGHTNQPQDSEQTQIRNGISTLASQALASAPITDMQIDPTLLQAAAGGTGTTSDSQIHSVPGHLIACKAAGAAEPKPVTVRRHSEPSQQHQGIGESIYRSVSPRCSPEFTFPPFQAPQPPSVTYADPKLNMEHGSQIVTFYIHPESTVFQNTGQWIGRLPEESVSGLQHALYSHIQGIRAPAGNDDSTSITIARIEGVWFDDTGARSISHINSDRDVETYLQNLAGHSAIFAFVVASC